jgi:2-oxoglutarate ferredoxin oxidoreductase subunit alpha
LLQAFAGRHGESPIPILAPASPADCFDIAIEAFRIAVRHCTPVFVLSEGYLANAAEPWRIPDPSKLAPIVVEHRSEPAGYLPYMRDEATLARPWVVPGTPGLEHRIGGLEKEHLTGNVSYDPDNHERMCRLRAEKVARIADFLPPAVPVGPAGGDLLVLSWGGSYGAVFSATDRVQKRGKSVAHLHLRHLNPFPKNLGEVLARYRRVLIPELNLGQLALLVRARYLVDAISFQKVKGRPFAISEVEAKIEESLQ